MVRMYIDNQNRQLGWKSEHSTALTMAIVFHVSHDIITKSSHFVEHGDNDYSRFTPGSQQALPDMEVRRIRVQGGLS